MNTRILFLSHRIPWPVKDGGCLAIHNNLKGFREAGCDVKLMCLNPRKDHSSPVDVPVWFSECRPEYFPLDTGVKITGAFLNLFSIQSYHVVRFYSEAFARRLEQVLEEEDFDVVHMEGAFIGQYSDILRKKSKACLVLREHNVEYQIWERMAKGTSNPLKRYYLNLLARRLRNYEEALWKKQDLIEAISPDDLQVFRQYNTNSFLGGVGFDLKPYMEAESRVQPNSMFHLGSMDWLPNREAVDFILEQIWPRIEKEMPEWSLDLAGKKMPAHLIGAKGKLRVQGEVDSAIGYMSQFEVMLVPLRSGSGIRIKTLEAMALGKVVITTRIGLQGIAAKDREEVLVADTPEEFAKALSWLNSEAGRKERIGAAARRLVQEHYDNEGHIRLLLENYRNCKRT